MDLSPAPLATLAAGDVALTFGIIAGQVTLAATAEAPLPDWIKITPAGRSDTRDGRAFTFDPVKLAARFGADAVNLAVDTDHSVAKLAPQGLKPNVVGFIKAVEARPDGTYGRVDWGSPAVARRTLKSHPYVSPTFHHDAAGNATWLHSVALVSAPALGNMPALAHASPHQDAPMKKIAKALGLTEDATEDACVAALAARTEVKPLAAALGLSDTADAAACLAAATTLKAGGGQAALVAELQGKVTTLGAEVETTRKTMRDRDVAELLDGALRDKKIVPAQRESYAAMCSTDEGIANVRRLVAATPAMLAASGLDARTVPTDGGDASVDATTLAAEAQKLVTDGAFNNIADAVMHLHHKTEKKG